MKKIILHTHTSGCNFNHPVEKDYQPINIASIIIDDNNKIIDKWEGYLIYLESNKWETKAFDAHGISRKYLAEHGTEHDLLATDFITLLSNHFDLMNDEKLYVVGYTLDMTLPFVKKFCGEFKLNWSFSNIDLKGIWNLDNGPESTMKDFISTFGTKKYDEYNRPSSLEMCYMFYRAYKLYKNMLDEYYAG